jgi:hypothetical protein
VWNRLNVSKSRVTVGCISWKYRIGICELLDFVVLFDEYSYHYRLMGSYKLMDNRSSLSNCKERHNSCYRPMEPRLRSRVWELALVLGQRWQQQIGQPKEQSRSIVCYCFT